MFAAINLFLTGAPSAPPGQQAYTDVGTYSWTAPAGVTSVSVVCVGKSGKSDGVWVGDALFAAGAGGGALSYKNNFTVIPGNSYSVVVGADGTNADTSFNSTTCSAGCGGNDTGSGPCTGGPGGAVGYGDGGGAGGAGGNSVQSTSLQYDSGGGGGAGGYAGAGGAGHGNGTGVGSAGSGGGGGGGGNNFVNGGAGFGGGVGLLGQGSSGAGGASSGGNAAMSGAGGSGGLAYTGSPPYVPLCGGGSRGGGGYSNDAGVRIIWPGTTRQFPSTNTANM